MTKTHPILVICMCALVATSAAAAEIAFKERCRARSGAVTLGDVAEIHSADAAEAQKLARIELFDAPAAEKPPTYSYREIAELLRVRGVDLSRHELSGATQVTVEAAAGIQAASAAPARDARAEGVASAAIMDYLQNHVSADVEWKIETASGGDVAGAVQARVVNAPEFSASDLSAASGTHTFALELRGSGRTWQRNVEARVTLPPLAVVAAEALSKGTILRAEHLELQPAPVPKTTGTRPRPTGFLVRLEDAVGRELLQTVAAGQSLDEKMLRRPILVTKGELVTVSVTCEGVRIRTAARAKEDGAQGDVIQVESTLDRRTYQVRVSGLGTVEVFVQPASLANSEEPKDKAAR
ncbi:MAG: flagellar basal body P-ring formation protein FlgA [Planctomycetia bacterium]|nr:flagellar basal body P-ring formation protein FlgA [Planctomycetia bacterium]